MPTEARLRLALDAAEMGLWDWDLTTGTLVWDERSARMYGTTLIDSTGTIADVEARVHPDDLGHVQATLSGAAQQLGAVDVEFRVVWPCGTTRWLYGRGQALPGPDGRAARLIGTNVDVTEQRRAAEQRAADARRMAGLVAIARQLGETRSEVEVLHVVTGQGAELLGAQGAVLCLAKGEEPVRALSTTFFDDEVRAHVAELPRDFPLPMIDTAVEGRSHFLRDRAAAVERFPSCAGLYEQARTEGSAAVPLRAQGALIGSLSVAFDAPFPWRQADRELLEAFAALTAQAVDRIHAHQAERLATHAVHRMSETLQRSLLSAPPTVPGMTIAVRYLPAAEQAQVGGDWYDAFFSPTGDLTLVIGDVAGHDQDAAAAMAQVRNITRGVAQRMPDTPAMTLTALDRAMRNLGVTTLATAVLGQVVRNEGGALLRWSNAGHPPPLLLHPDGTTELLAGEPDLLLGLDAETSRADGKLELAPGATLLLVTDGLVEKRGLSLDDGLARLQNALSGLHDLDVEQLCDELLERLANKPQDDIALLALRVEA